MKLKYCYKSDIDNILENTEFVVTESVKEEINKHKKIFKLRDKKDHSENSQISWD